MVELVFLVEETPPGFAIVGERRLAQQVDVTARAEAAPFGMVDDHGLDGIVIAPGQQRLGHGMVHALRQGVDRLGAVEREKTRRAFLADDDFGGLAHFSRSRPMIMRMISLVPSRMRWTRRSRQKRSIG